MILDRNTIRRREESSDEAQILLNGQVMRTGTKAHLQPLFYEEVKKHSAPIELRMKREDGKYHTVLKRA